MNKGVTRAMGAVAHGKPGALGSLMGASVQNLTVKVASDVAGGLVGEALGIKE